MTNKYVPLNDYVLIEIPVEAEADLINPDANDELTQTGIVVDPGKHNELNFGGDPQQFVEVGDTVEWVRFSGSGRTKKLSDGRQIAQIPFDRLTMKLSSKGNPES